jgi:Na+-transporting methylmalonyl-CoA/oxaloacetate decarboxylase gamma subunit
MENDAKLPQQVSLAARRQSSYEGELGVSMTKTCGKKSSGSRLNACQEHLFLEPVTKNSQSQRFSFGSNGLTMVVLFLFLLISCVPAIAQGERDAAGTQEDAPLKVPMLKGQLEHSERVEPLDNRLKAGAQFNEGLFRNLTPNNIWVPIPHWLAGVWETRHEVRLKSTDLITGKSSAPAVMKRHDIWTFGMQLDKNGQVWHYLEVPSFRGVEFNEPGLGAAIEYRHEILKEFPILEQDLVGARYRFTAISVSKATGTIIRVHQQETLWSLRPFDQNTVKAQASFKTFTRDGVPWLLSDHVTPFFKVRPFSVMDTYHGQDMRTLFREFLISHGHPELVPE